MWFWMGHGLFLDFFIERNSLRTSHFLDRRPKTTTTPTTTTTTVASTTTLKTTATPTTTTTTVASATTITTSTATWNLKDGLKLGCSEEKVRGVFWPATKAGDVSQMACPNGTTGEPYVL